MWRLIGLSPIAHPPGMETSARQQRATKGPSMQMLARILRTISYSPTGLSITVESIDSWPFGPLVTLQPNCSNNLLRSEMSERFGVPLIADLPPGKMAAAIIGREAFLEPFILTLPASLTGPSMRNTSINCFTNYDLLFTIENAL
jgi:hypothetical protein